MSNSASVLGAVQVGHDADLAAVVGQAVAQDGFGAVLDHHGLHGAVHQQAAAGVPVGAVACIDAAALEEQAVAAGQAGVAAAQADQPGDQARQHGGAARAGDAHHGDAAGCVVGEQVVADRAAHRARRADGGLQVHQQAGAGVDLDDGAALRCQRAGDVLRHQVDAGDVQADHARGQHGGMRDLGVDLVGAVDGHVAVALDRDDAAGRGHGRGVQVLALELELQLGVGRDVQDVEREFFLGAAPRVAVELAVDQLGDGGAGRRRSR